MAFNHKKLLDLLYNQQEEEKVDQLFNSKFIHLLPLFNYLNNSSL